MKFLQEMIARKRQGQDGADAAEDEGRTFAPAFEIPEMSAVSEDVVALDEAREGLQQERAQQGLIGLKPSEPPAQRPDFMDEGGSYDWDVSDIDLSDTKAEAEAGHVETDEEPAEDMGPTLEDEEDDMPAGDFAEEAEPIAEAMEFEDEPSASDIAAEADVMQFEPAVEPVEPEATDTDEMSEEQVTSDSVMARIQALRAVETAEQAPAESLGADDAADGPEAPAIETTDEALSDADIAAAAMAEMEPAEEAAPESADAAAEADSDEEPTPAPVIMPAASSQPKPWHVMPAPVSEIPTPAALPEPEEQPAPVAAEASAPAEPDVALSEPQDEAPFAAPAEEAAPRRRTGRVKTRLLGFHSPDTAEVDPITAATAATAASAAAAGATAPASPKSEIPHYPVGWVIVTEGPGRGASFTLLAGASKIGRGADQAVRLDFGDTSISRDNHAVVAYDDEQRRFFIGHGGKANLVRLNGMPVLSTESLQDGDKIRIGETTLQFIALCGPEFSWEAEETPETSDAASL